MYVCVSVCTIRLCHPHVEFPASSTYCLHQETPNACRHSCQETGVLLSFGLEVCVYAQAFRSLTESFSAGVCLSLLFH